MFLGYKVNTTGLKVCPDKVDAILSLPSPNCLKDVQKLNGKLASLNRFLAKSAEKSLPFFKTLKKCTKKSDFHWTTEAEEAFKQMKQLIAELPMLTAPLEKEELIVYLATAKEADCQVHKPVPRNPQQKLTPITSSWPFYKWRIDIAEPFPEGPGRVKFLIVAIDYFTKWIKAKPVATITGNQIKKFAWDNITNGLVERANRSLGEGIKERLDARSKNWMEDLPHVLWAHYTMIKSSNGDTPFSLTYETEAVIPAEIGMPTLRTAKVDLVQNNEALEINLDLLEEMREEAAIHEAKRDLVYRNNDASRAEDTGKLGRKWEGPYEVTEALGKGAYKLRDCDGKQLPRTWNISNLTKCYVHKM
ncbi:reverse transcriptase domain-containing protein [Tanacetum coccineum]|uniref:Reverse transcriptase domain-containing protein n=1 Tax=Tanacetum coccineum TaxID=301880 RepID=A0ABQ5ATR0_9ASTR